MGLHFTFLKSSPECLFTLGLGFFFPPLRLFAFCSSETGYGVHFLLPTVYQTKSKSYTFSL